ncbi:MAG: nicotinate-nucleotide adenylyltransferase [Chloroflexota bacterium]|nr:nicotinate-nucleotide adenylyltransferase [Chloroflexota bacterium]
MINRRRVGILGGTFDPIHIGHLHIAQCARHDLHLDEVIYMPAASPPHKPDQRLTDGAERLAMIDAAIEGIEGLGSSDIDLQHDTPSYTNELLKKYQLQHPCTDLWFIMGSDSLHEFHTWHRPNSILDLARLAVAERPGWQIRNMAEHAEAPDLLRSVDRFNSVPIDLSSTTIRKCLAQDLPVDWLVPPQVLSLIQKKTLYR